MLSPAPEAVRTSASDSLIMRLQHQRTHTALAVAVWTHPLRVASSVDLGVQEIWLLYCFLIKSISLLNFPSLPLSERGEEAFFSRTTRT